MYWLQEALRLAIEEAESRLVDAGPTANSRFSANSTEVFANPTKVAATLGQAVSNLGQVFATLGQVAANLGQAPATLGQAIANLDQVATNYYNYRVIIAIGYYHHNYGVGLEEYLILEPITFIEKHRGLLHLHQFP